MIHTQKTEDISTSNENEKEKETQINRKGVFIILLFFYPTFVQYILLYIYNHIYIYLDFIIIIIQEKKISAQVKRRCWCSKNWKTQPQSEKQRWNRRQNKHTMWESGECTSKMNRLRWSRRWNIEINMAEERQKNRISGSW